MLLRYSLGLEKEAIAVESAVRKVLDNVSEGGSGYRTKDLGGDVGTKDMGRKIAEVLKGLI
jgi:3-isopropylmalate dehydrogenase